MALRVLEIFDSLQGEGYWTGTPMTFVRLAGCNAAELGLDCASWCDTPSSWRQEAGRELEVRDVILRVGLPRVCVTGGEPLLQGEGVLRFATEARGLGMKVHIETNGTVSPPSPGRSVPDGRAFDWATVSPKPPDYKIAAGWVGLIDEIKLIVDGGLTAGVAERVAADHPEALVSIQPLWSGAGASQRGGAVFGPGQWSTEAAVKMVMDHPEWRLSLQTHKLLGIR